MKRILVPCDFSETAREAFKFAVQLTQQSSGELHVLFVIDMTFMGGGPSLSHAYTFNVQFLREMERESENKFQKMWEKLAPVTLAAKFRHRIGSLADETRQYVDENKIDLVVMGTNGTGGSKWGSNVEKLVRNSTVPVIAIRNAPTRAIHDIVVPVSMVQPDEIFVEKLKELQQFFGATLHLLYVNTPYFFTKDSAMKKQLASFIDRHGLTNCVTHFRSDTSVQEGIAEFMKEKSYDMIAMGTHGWKGFAHFIFGSVTEDVVNSLQAPIWTCPLR